MACRRWSLQGVVTEFSEEWRQWPLMEGGSGRNRSVVIESRKIMIMIMLLYNIKMMLYDDTLQLTITAIITSTTTTTRFYIFFSIPDCDQSFFISVRTKTLSLCEGGWTGA